ncbi:hypothetical protein lerEdw1_000355 [Lerista edwardsae]|nr:hypothetical protein lerEdw1_000355 [Lerista edwardsae]
MMSKTSAKRQIVPTKVIDWVEPSFSDFSKNTKSSSSIPHKKSTTDSNDHWKRKEHVPQLGRGKSERKKGKRSSVDERYELSRQNLSQTEPWVDKYKPKAQNELAIHKKKIEEVEAWLKAKVFQRQAKQDLHIQVQEWINPISLDFKKDDFQDALHHGKTIGMPESEFQILPYQSQTTVFEEFLLRANKYTKLQMIGESMETDKRLILVENGEKIDVPDKASLELICKGCSGDIRSAINSLQFSSLKESPWKDSLQSHRKEDSTLKYDILSKVKKKKKSDNPLESQEVQAIGGKDASIFLFHALGKILYCKRELTTGSDFPHLPAHLSEYERNPLLVQPEDVIEKSHMPGDLFNLYLHQNYVEFFSDIDDLMRASEYLSTADFLCSNWDYRENCTAAKFLFSSFCLPPLCLQIQLLPYLALLTNPMRNQAQITFIQDVGRLPLKKHFRRLKLETLTDKDSAVQVLDSDDDRDFAEMQPTNEFIQAKKKKTSEDNEPDESPLPSSQSSGNELLGSQPQPIAAQAIMEEDELNIEEYDSD